MKIYDVYINESNSYVVEVEAKDEYEAHDEVFHNLHKYMDGLIPSDAGYSDIEVGEAVEIEVVEAVERETL